MSYISVMKTKEWYKLKMMSYGIISLLLVMKYFEDKEMYEECAKIKELANEIGFKSIITEDLIEEVTSSHKGIWSKEQVLEANRYYSEVIINDALDRYEVIEITPNNI